MDTLRSAILKNEKILLLALVICMIAWGLSILHEASYYFSLRYQKIGYYYVLRQTVYVIFGFVIFFFVQKIDLIKKILRWPYLWIVLASVVPLIPNIDDYSIYGASRWIIISLPGPDRLVIHTGLWSLILFFIGILILNASNRSWTTREKIVTACAAVWIGIMLLKQPDTIMFIFLFIISVCYLFKNGRTKTALALMACLVCIIMCYIFWGPQYIQSRILNVFDYNLSDPFGDSYQILQSRFAFYHGQWFGVGVGNTISSRLNLPEAHGGFIFSVLAEAHGLAGVAVYIMAIIAFFCFGIRAIAHTNNQLEKDVLQFMVYFIVICAFTSIAVTVQVLPIFDSQLPFISYGGVMTMLTLFTAAWIFKNLNNDDGGEMKIKIFALKNLFTLTILVVAALLFIRAINISYEYYPVFNAYLNRPNECIQYFVK